MARRARVRIPSWVSKPSLRSDDDAVDVDVVGGGMARTWYAFTIWSSLGR